MIASLVDILNSAITLDVQTKHGLAQLITGTPHVHVGAGQWKPVAEDADGAWSYFRLNGQISVDASDGPVHGGLAATIPLRMVALLRRPDCDELPGVLIAVASDIRATAKAAKGVIGANAVVFPSIRMGIDEVLRQEFATPPVVPADRVLVNVDLSVRITGSPECLALCDTGTPGEIRIPATRATKLGELADVDVPSPEDGQVLTYDEATKKYVLRDQSAGVTDHGALTGLGDDDHPQYLTADRGDARYDALGAASNAQSAAAADATTKANNAEQAAKDYAATLVVGLLDDRGPYDASGNVFPSTGGSGPGGAIMSGDLWTITVPGTIGGEPVEIHDTVRALTNNPGQTVGNWAIAEANIDQASEVKRGTLKVALKADVEDPTTTNDTDAITPRKWWMAMYRFLALSPKLVNLNGMNSVLGLVEQIGSDTFTKRGIGVSASTDIPTRGDADARYAALHAPVFMDYTGGSQTNSTTTFANIHSSASFSVGQAGMYDFVITIVYSVNATTTGVKFGVDGGAMTYDMLIGSMIAMGGNTGRSTIAFASYSSGNTGYATNGSVSTGPIRATLTGTILATSTGTLNVVFGASTNVSNALVVTSVSGFIQRRY